MRIGFFTVGLLAMLGFSGCGVGVDDPEGMAAATGAQGQALLDANGQPLPPPPNELPTTDPGDKKPGDSNLPQDPVPIHDPRALYNMYGWTGTTTSTTTMTPSK
jgi:hypothetical protein